MKIDIVTPSRNQGHFIRQAIESVRDQGLPCVAHIVVDACSTDETVSILKEYPEVQWVSEPDSGQSNAINKGIGMGQSELIGWLNADDMLEPDGLRYVIQAFEENPEADVVYGDITFVDKNGDELRDFSGATLTCGRLMCDPDVIRQPSMFFRRGLWKRLGGLREDLDLVFDYAFFLRAVSEKPFVYVPRVLSRYRHYAETKSRSMQASQAAELMRVAWEAGTLGPKLMMKLVMRYFRIEEPVQRLRGKCDIRSEVNS
jgi:glycosyltransferase involved in cell wall biosynthesis